MTLERHVMDTLKEWQIKIGNFESGIRLYYPKTSLCDYLNLDTDIDNGVLGRQIEEYFRVHANFLGDISVSVNQDRFCIWIGKSGCDYIENNVPVPEFLTNFLEILKSQNMSFIQNYFEEYAKRNQTRVCMEREKDDMGIVLYFEDENIEPYVYCIDQNEFGITYHRFTRNEYRNL